MKYLIFLFFPSMLWADIVVATRTIRPHEILAATDLEIRPDGDVETASDLAQLVGLETRVALYPGKPVRLSDLAPPALVGRNDKVVILFQNSGLQIRTEGRALGRAALGQEVRVMNLASRRSVYGTVLADGSVEVKR